MTRLNTNILANYFGQFIAAATGFVVIPLYLHFLGDQGYGVVSLFLSMQTVLLILDLGMSTSASREISRLTAQHENPAEARNLLRTLEVFYGLLTLLICGGLAAGADWIATQWIRADSIPAADIRLCALLMAGCISLRFPVALYQGCFRGMERQVKLNAIITVLAVVKGAGAVAVLAWISPTVTAFYKWQLLFQIGEVAILAIGAWSNLGGLFGPAKIEVALLKPVWRFAMGVAGISLLAILMKQFDKMAVSARLPIEFVGYYATAGMASGALIKLYQPIATAIFPRFNKLVAQNDSAALAPLFHEYSQLVSFFVSPFAAMLICFPEQILLLWTHSRTVAEYGAAPLCFLSVNMLTTALLTIPNALMLAKGLTRLPLLNNAITTLAIIPGVLLGVTYFGLTGAALCWLLAGALSFVLLPHFMFHHLLRDQQRAWYFTDTLPLVAAALAIFQTIAWLAQPAGLWQLTAALALGFTAYCALAVWRFPALRAFTRRTPLGRLFPARPVMTK